MTLKPSLASILTVTALLAALVSLWVTLKTTANQKQFHLRLTAAEGDIREIQAYSNAASPEVAIQIQTLTSNVTAQLDALRQELKPVQRDIHTVTPRLSGISSPGENMKYYIIRSGDTFTSIAAEQDLTLEDLEAANPRIDHDDLDVGQRIKIPIYPAAE